MPAALDSLPHEIVFKIVQWTSRIVAAEQREAALHDAPFFVGGLNEDNDDEPPLGPGGFFAPNGPLNNGPAGEGEGLGIGNHAFMQNLFGFLGGPHGAGPPNGRAAAPQAAPPIPDVNIVNAMDQDANNAEDNINDGLTEPIQRLPGAVPLASTEASRELRCSMSVFKDIT